jgi:propionate CoA-transferase
MFSKVVDVMTTLSKKDNAIIAISGFNNTTTPEYLILELIDDILKKDIQKNIFIISDSLPVLEEH